MTEELTEARRNQYQHQTLTLHNTIGLVFMSIIAFVLLVALLRQQKRYDELIMKISATDKLP